MQALLPYVEINPKKSPIASVIWLHGLGADGHDFESIVPELNLPEFLPIRFLFPHAPMRPITINGGYMMRAWFDIEEISLHPQEEEEGIYEAEKMIGDLIKHENDLNIPAHRIILAGFSQGGALALHTGLRYPEKLGGILSLSGFLPMHRKLAKEVNSVNQSIPIMMAHGEMDPLIPITMAQFTCDYLKENGYAVEFHTYPVQHGICQAEIDDISAWLQIK